MQDDDRITLQSQFDDEELQPNTRKTFDLEFQFAQNEDVQNKPFGPGPKSANVREDLNIGGSKSHRGGRQVVGMAGTGGFNESGMISSEAQEFLMLEQQTASEFVPGYDNMSTSSMPLSAFRASMPSQSGATRTFLKPAKQPAKSLLGRYNQNLNKQKNQK